MLKKINWRYAFGEIAIVIIGITIAFSLNKWAENARNETARTEYLQSLLIDLESEQEQLQNHRIIQLDYQRQNKINETYPGNFMVHEIDYFQLRRGNYDFMEAPLLRNIIQSLYGTYQIAINTSKDGIGRCEQLKALIKQELQP